MGGYWALYPFGSALAKVQASIDACLGLHLLVLLATFRW